MTFTLDTVRNCAIPNTATTHAGSLEAQIFRQPSNCGRVRTPNLYDLSLRSWSRSLEKSSRIAARPSAFKHAEHSKPNTYGLPCLITCRHKDEKERHRRRASVIARCETECNGHSPEQTPCHEEQKCSKREQTPGHEERNCDKREQTPGHEERKCHKREQTPGHEERKCHKREHVHSEQTPGHEEQKCHKREHVHSERPPGCEGCEGELREWKGMKDARHEQVRMEAESEWQNEEESPPEYTPRHGGGEKKSRVSSTLSVADKGYVIKVSRELMGLFCYIEKRKRTTIKELAETLRQIATVSVVITCVRGVFAPLVEVFKTTPPTWSKLLLMLVSFDSIAICYLAIKSAEPLEQLATITTENRRDIMEGVEKEEEMILKIAIEFIRLFKRLRNIAISITVSQTAQLIFTVLRMKDPNFVGNCLRVVQTWMQAPWT